MRLFFNLDLKAKNSPVPSSFQIVGLCNVCFLMDGYVDCTAFVLILCVLFNQRYSTSVLYLPMRMQINDYVLGGSGRVVNSLDFCSASLKSLGCFYFQCILSSQ